jgi:hypothetical protein
MPIFQDDGLYCNVREVDPPTSVTIFKSVPLFCKLFASQFLEFSSPNF